MHWVNFGILCLAMGILVVSSFIAAHEQAKSERIEYCFQSHSGINADLIAYRSCVDRKSE